MLQKIQSNARHLLFYSLLNLDLTQRRFIQKLTKNNLTMWERRYIYKGTLSKSS